MTQTLSTQEKILKAARTLFVEHGYAGTSIGKIAKLAAINHSLIFHHFNNKEQLWVAVKEQIITDAEHQESVVPDTQLPFKTFLTKLFENQIKRYQRCPDIVKMIYWQRVETNNKQPSPQFRTKHINTWTQALAHYQQQGDINPDLSLEFIVFMIAALMSQIACDAPIFIKTKKQIQEYRQFCIERILISLKK